MFKTLDSCSVHIVGLGLMGGSLALALRDHVARLTAQDIEPGILIAAQETRVIDAAGSTAEADIVILATPADHIIRLIPTLELRPGALVIDLGSTKTRICDQLDRLPDGVLAVGGHPLCGLAENGYRNAIGTLYRRARFVLCETTRTTAEACALAEALVRACQAIPIWMDRTQHDHLTAITSHLPHLLSFGLMRLAMQVATEDNNLYELAAGGFDGATRLARTSESMVTGMLSTNAEQLRAVTARLRDQLDAIDALLDDPGALQAELAMIVAARRSYTADYGERLIT
ncbi:MAG: prephenate dehydrogenase [Chloroflexi bacterium]|nr:prephenate dehydrogenase [Chloroflexota bacterium]